MWVSRILGNKYILRLLLEKENKTKKCDHPWGLPILTHYTFALKFPEDPKSPTSWLKMSFFFLPVKVCVEAFLGLFKLSFSLRRLINPGRNRVIAENKSFCKFLWQKARGKCWSVRLSTREKVLITYLQIRSQGPLGEITWKQSFKRIKILSVLQVSG